MVRLQELLTERSLRIFAGPSIYTRGAAYFRSERVRVKYADEHESECIVRGTSYYKVTLWLHQGDDLGSMCSCPYAARGWFCKHMVAAGLAVVEYLELYGEVLWRPRLDVLLEGLQNKTRKSPTPYWLFISLQRQTNGWKLLPHHILINQIPKGVFPDDSSELTFQLPELVKHNRWILENIKSNGRSYRDENCVNGDDGGVSIANLLIEHNKYNENRYHHYFQNDPYNLAYLLPVLARSNLPLFLGDYRNPIRSKLDLLDKSVHLSLEVERTDVGLQLNAVIRNGEQVLGLSNTRAEVITANDVPWVMTDDSVFRIQSDVDLEYISPWLQNPILEIPNDQEDQFLEDYFPTLAEHISVEGSDISWEFVNEEPIKRLYLTESSTDSELHNDEIQIHLRFGYGDYEVVYQNDCPDVSIIRKPESWTLLRINRDSVAEKHIWNEVS
ncbi:SNF2 helicase associated domain-containing protein, partial [Chloroflexota bacterium]